MNRNVKSIAVIGEGETEWFYFNSLRLAARYPFKMVPTFPSHADIGHMLKSVKQYVNQQYDYVICLVDMDRLIHVKAEMNRYKREKNKLAKNVIIVETNPCTEFWFLLHFLPNLTDKVYQSCDELIPELQKYMPGYEKTKRYFRSTNLYEYLCKKGSIDIAMKNSKILCEMSKNNPKDEHSYSEIYKVFELLNKLSPIDS